MATKQTLSPHELNKFSYCPHQWYYQRKYGQSQLREWQKQGIQKKQTPVTRAQRNFTKGEQFHQNLYQQMLLRNRKIKRYLTVSVILLLLIVMVLGVVYYGGV